MRKKLLHLFLIPLGVLAFADGLMAQTNLNIVAFRTVNLNGTVSNLMCPGNSYDMDFTVSSGGQLNAFAVVDVTITDVNNATNPINGTVVGTFNNGPTAITGPSAPITIANVTIPLGLATSTYRFELEVANTQVTPSPAVSTTITRELIQNPQANIVLDTASSRYDNVFFTDSTLRLLSRIPGGPVTANGVALIPPSAEPDPQITLRDSTVNFCAGDSLFLWNPDSLTADEHVWLVDGVQIPNLPLNQGHLWVYASGYYSLMVTSSNTCDDSTSAISVGDPDPFTGSVSPRNKGVYFNAYNVDTTLQRIGNGNLSGPGGTVGSPNRFCEGDSMILSARGTSSHPLGEYSYYWVANGTDTLNLNDPKDSAITIKDAGNYQVFIHEHFIRNGDTIFQCSAVSNSVSVTVDPLPRSALSVPSNSLICYGDTFDLQYLFANESYNQYDWFLNGQLMNTGRFVDTNFIRVDTATLAAFGVDVDTSAYFQIRVTDTLGCDSLSNIVRIDFTPYPEIRLVPNQTTFLLCPGDTLEVNAVIQNGVAASFRWFDSNGDLVTNTGLLRTPNEDTYTVEATTNDGCVKTRDITVSFYTVIAEAGPNITARSGETVTLTGSGGDSYKWGAEIGKPIAVNDFFAQTISVSYTLPDSVLADTVKIYLTVTDDNGCTAMDSMFLFVNRGTNDSITLLSRVPNLFTPNGDAFNNNWDIREIIGDNDVCELRILNRWGRVVYTDDRFIGLWDGNDNGGNPLPDGTYYYVLSCNEVVRLKSAVTIIRNQN